jgi:hypothetical protein
MKANPGGHIDPKDLVGRDGLIGEYWRILDRQSLVLTSERRIGKTCVISKMHHEHQGDILTCFRDLEKARTPLEFLDAVYEDVKTYLTGLKKIAARFQRILTSLSGAEFKGLKLPATVAPHWKSLLSNLIEDLAEHQNHLVVFFWDEFPLFLHNIQQDKGPREAMELLDTLRSCRQMFPRLRMVFTGSIGIHNVITSLKRQGYMNEPINDMAKEILPPLTNEDAKDLARRLIQGENIQTPNPEELAESIAEASDGIPYYIHHFVDQMVKAGRNAQPEDVERIVSRALVSPTDIWDMRYYRRRIDLYYPLEERPFALAILDAAAGTPASLSFPSLFSALKARVPTEDQETARLVLEKLLQDHYLVQETSGAYRFTFALIQRWWKLHRGI